MKKILTIGFLFACLTLQATHYYVKNGGSDAATGLSDALAWSSMTKVYGSSFSPDDTISFKRGSIWREKTFWPSSGSLGHNIVLNSYGTGAKPIMQNTSQITSWTQVGSSNIYYATRTSNPVNVIINDVYCQPCHYPTTVGSNPAVFGYPSGNSADHTHLTDITLTGKTTAQLTGAMINIYSTEHDIRTSIVSAFDGTSIMTTAYLTEVVTTAMPYYLTAPAASGRSYANKEWMMTENTWFYDTDAQRLYVWKTGGGSPGTVETASASSSSFIILNKSYVTVDGIHFRYSDIGLPVYATTGDVGGIVIKNCELNYNPYSGIRCDGTVSYKVGVSITNNLVTYNNQYYGIEVSYYKTSLIQGDTVLYTNTYPLLPGIGYGIMVKQGTNDGNFITINNNVVSYSTKCGICVQTSYNAVITNNKVDHTDIYLPDGGGIYNVDTDNSIISGNILTGGTGAGLYLDDASANCIVELNSVDGGVYGGEFSALSTNNIMRRNVFTGPFNSAWEPGVIMISHSITNTVSYNIINGVDKSCRGIISSTGTNGLNNVYNNLIMNCDIGLTNHATYANAYNNVKNNIFYNNTTHISEWSGNVTAIDYNLFYGTGNWIWGGATEATLALWKTASSGDANSLNSDPLFTSGSDFNLQAGSPARDKGANVGLTLDYDGKKVPYNSVPDIGILEYSHKYYLLIGVER